MSDETLTQSSVDESQKTVSRTTEPDSAVTPSCEGRLRGYGWIIATIFIVSGTAGSGVVALPNAFRLAGFFGGPLFLIIVCGICTYSGYTLGSSWLVLLELFPQLKSEPCRTPYAELVKRTLGRIGALMLHLSMDMTLFFVMAAYLILAATNVSDLLTLFSIRVHRCIALLVIAVVIWPLTMLRSPSSFWQVPIVACCSTFIAIILMIIGTSFDFDVCYQEVGYNSIQVRDVFMSISTLVFSFSGHVVFLTVQDDMKEPKRFPYSLLVAYSIMLVMYSPLSIYGYVTYGNSLTESIILSIQSYGIRQVVNTLITCYLFLSIVIMGNPLYQAAEDVLHIKDEFGIGRILTRSFIFFAAVFSAASLPSFGLFLDLIGGSCSALTSFIFPGITSLFIQAMKKTREKGIESDEEDDRLSWKQMISYTPKKSLIINGGMVVFAMLFGSYSTYSTLSSISFDDMGLPCYLELFRVSSNSTNEGMNRCCGNYKNISIYPDGCSVSHV